MNKQTTNTRFLDYANTFARVLAATQASDAAGKAMDLDSAVARVHELMRRIAHGTNKIMFVGNGGSAGIAGHMAIDFAKNGGVRSLTFNDASSLTCLGNDLGYENVFAKQIEMQGFKGDGLIAISSSGASKNILRAAEAARTMGCEIVTLSGFTAANSLRSMGDVNFFVDSGVYGFVETGHQVILHAILDTAMGWTTAAPSTQPSSPVR